MTIDGLNLEDCIKIPVRNNIRNKHFIYLLNKTGDDTILLKDKDEKFSYYRSPEITPAHVTILDSSTDQISKTSVYRDHIGTYIKKRGCRYRLEKFK